MKEAHLPKSDILFLLVGTNPFPNLISSLTRVKDDGLIHFFYTVDQENSQTNKVFERLKELLSKKKPHCRSTGSIIDKSRVNKIEEDVKEVLSRTYSYNPNQLQRIELNYTGGTKVMAAGTYHAFKNFAHSQAKDIFVLSYIDGEKEQIYYEVLEGENEKYVYEPLRKLEGDYSISILEISQLHDIPLKENPHLEIYDSQLAERFFQLFIDPSEEEYQSHIKFLEVIYSDMVHVSDKLPNNKNKANELIHERLLSLNNPIFESEYNPFPDIHSYRDFSKDRKLTYQFKDYLSGFWLEDYVLKVVLELMEENKNIIDVHHSVKPNKQSSKDFEVDIVLLKKYKLFSISVTTQEKEEEAILKLFEVKERAKQLGGDESGICLVSLCRNSNVLEKEYKNIWDNDSPKNTLIIGQDRFKNIKQLFVDWINE
ncbi:Card1-like endonuclease domain-containing protein [Tepidibacillus fermentans]|uniref:Uncharacterized protein DUF1887 n=1 Tax=Tepidibacillus fermentans TaxID=1281767 RepID=A0A4R3K7X8_9BACI|nr:DUF1887 family protein [Tepidibacillus fermentans]TCS78938.1 uncharacterized protein DUF1887 [Tepidibacillus fermentans]